MPWDKTPADRRRDSQVYGPEYRKARAAARRRDGGRCVERLEDGRRCGSTDRIQVDHIIPTTQGGTHHVDNLRCLCFAHHARKTAQEGKGYRRRGGRAKTEDPPLQRRTKW